MRIAEIVDRLPRDEAQMLAATTPQVFDDFCRRRIFEARDLLVKMWQETQRLELLDVADLLPNDPCHFDQVIATAEGQEVIRGRIARARELLENLE